MHWIVAEAEMQLTGHAQHRATLDQTRHSRVMQDVERESLPAVQFSLANLAADCVPS